MTKAQPFRLSVTATMGWGVALTLLPHVPAAKAGGSGSLPSYYEVPEPTGRPSTRQPAISAQPSLSPRKVFVTGGGESNMVVGSNGSREDVSGLGDGIPSSSGAALPPTMERGVKDLEDGMDDLRRYTGVMAKHIQANGLRGFLAVPAQIKEQGAAVGRKIGNGISGIATDTGRDMIAPENR